jgi:hypothetical protein
VEEALVHDREDAFAIEEFAEDLVDGAGDAPPAACRSSRRYSSASSAFFS